MGCIKMEYTLVKLDRSLTGNDYGQLLGDHFQPFMDFMHQINDRIFQSDNAACHRAITVLDCFEEHLRKFQRTIWRLRWNNMNPIEYLWDIIERSLRALSPLPSTHSELWTSVEAASLNTSPEELQWVVEFKPQRVAALPRWTDVLLAGYPMIFVTSVYKQCWRPD